MPHPIKNVAGALLISLLLWSPLAAYESPTSRASRPFQYGTDTFAFANETVWHYANGSLQADPSRSPERTRDYTRRCFVVTRAAVQFWKFAWFDPHAAPPANGLLASRIREVTERSVWLPPLSRAKKIVFPGYANLRDISAAYPTIFQENIGLGWPVYFRAGNMPIIAPVYRETEAQLNGEIFRDLRQNYPSIVWMYNFPSLNINHVVVIFDGSRDHDQFHYQVYDPNYSDSPKRLGYDALTRTFSYQPTFYFKGGTVNVRAVYRGVLQ